MEHCCVSEIVSDFLERSEKNSVLVEPDKPVEPIALAIKNLSALHFSGPSNRELWLSRVGVLHLNFQENMEKATTPSN
jgi:hypothetical protein